MPKAIFHRAFHYSARRQNAGWSIRPGAKPQTYPREVIDAAVAAGVATRVPPKRRGAARRPKDCQS